MREEKINARTAGAGKSGRITPGQVQALRLRAQHLHQKAPVSDMVKVVRSLGGVNAQFDPAMMLSLRARISGLEVAHVEEAIARKRLVRTWAMRGTVHLVDPGDLGWMIALLGPVLIRKGARRRLELGLDEDKVARGMREMETILQRGEPMTRAELIGRLIGRGLDIALKSQAPYHLLARAALEGIICIGPDSAGGEQTYCLCNGTRKGKSLTGDEALAELTVRYLSGYGPAGPKDLASWSGLPLADVKRGWDLLQGMDSIRTVTVGDRTLWSTKAQLRSLEKPLNTGTIVNLLPAFDSFVLGYDDRGLLVPEKFQNQVYHGGQTVPVILVNGRAAGTWRYARRGKRLDIMVSLFEPQDDAARALVEAEAEDIGRFYGLRTSLAYRTKSS